MGLAGGGVVVVGCVNLELRSNCVDFGVVEEKDSDSGAH